MSLQDMECYNSMKNVKLIEPISNNEEGDSKTQQLKKGWQIQKSNVNTKHTSQGEKEIHRKSFFLEENRMPFAWEI